jgi:hypothetical protein
VPFSVNRTEEVRKWMPDKGSWSDSTEISK